MTTDIEDFITESSHARGIDPSVALRVARSEGGTDEYSVTGMFDTGWSFWAYQLHYGGPGYLHYGTVAGMGNTFSKLTSWSPGDPLAWKDAIRYALNRAKTGGWSPWYGAAHVGVSQWEGISDSPWNPNLELWDYETRPPAPSTLIYNPDTPPQRQLQDWTCSIRTTAWMLESLGLPVDISDLQDEMVPRYVTPALGLLDARGFGLAAVLTSHLPPSYGPRVQVYPEISWADLVARAGSGPVGLGLHGAYHWLAVAKPLPDGTLSSPNPAPKYPGQAPIGDILTQDEFATYGPVSCVWVDNTPLAAPPVPDDVYAPWYGLVGSGLLDAMQADGTFPAQSRSTWLPLGSSPSEIEECVALSGTVYRWHLASSVLWTYRAD